MYRANNVSPSRQIVYSIWGFSAMGCKQRTEPLLHWQLSKLNYSGTSIIWQPMSYALLATIVKWLEYNVNSIKRSAPLWHKSGLTTEYECIINTVLLTQTAWTSTTKSKWAESWRNTYTHRPVPGGRGGGGVRGLERTLPPGCPRRPF